MRDVPVRNWGGAFGAYMADLLLSLFGRSAYWFIALFGALVAWAFRRIESVPESDRRSYIVALIGFGILLLASSGIEAIGLKSRGAILPHGSGGFIGTLISHAIAGPFGFIGGTIILLLAFA